MEKYKPSGDRRKINQIKINYTYITKNGIMVHDGIMMNYFVRKNILFHLVC